MLSAALPWALDEGAWCSVMMLVMAPPTPEQQRATMAALYAGMSDGELELLAAEAGALTEIAQECLRAEIERRHMAVELDLATVDAGAPAARNLVTVAQFRDLPEALMAKTTLQSAGIECFLIDDNMVRMDWFISNLLGGVKLRVGAPDVEAATSLLRDLPPESFEVEGVGEYQQPRCPECQSVDISYEGLNKPVAYASAWAGVPIPLSRHLWKCHACGHEWHEDANAE